MLARLCTLVLVLFAVAATPTFGQEDAFPYQQPPPELVELVDAPPPPAVSLSPDRQWMLLMERSALPDLVELAQPELALAGLRINPRTNGPSRTGVLTGLRLRPIDVGAAERVITGLPQDARIRNVSWSPDAGSIAFTLDLDDEVALYVADVVSGQAARVSDRSLNDAVGSPLTWLADGSLIARVIPEDRGTAPAAPTTPVGPAIQETTEDAAPARTFQNLLQNAHDEALFEHYLHSELIRIDPDGTHRSLGLNGLIRSVSRSPSGVYLLVQRIERPYSYLVPLYRFPTLVTVHEASTGDLVATMAEQPLAENVPLGFGSVPDGPRSFAWRANAPATLVWAEALDGGDIRTEADLRDRVLLLDAPFDGDARTLMETELRYAGISWTDAGDALVHETFFQTRARRSHLIDPDDAASTPRLVFDISTEDRYNNPGTPVTRPDGSGYSLVLTADGGQVIFLSGQGASPEGNRPFLRRHDLATGETEELFRSESPYYEIPVEMLGEEGHLLLTRRESPTEPPNFFLRNFNTGEVLALTDFPHPYPGLREVQREAIEYERADGVPLSAILYLPAGYDADRDGPLPTLVWAYPREFRSLDAAGQRTDSPYQFRRVSYWGAAAFVTRGYAVLDNAAMPIVGEDDEEPNDTFVDQLVLNAEAVIAEGVRRGVVDPDRIAVGGHSYGAFMTANLLAYTDLFRAGIARSGAYNRTLTPFGFQYEQRTYWEAPEIYNAMSPFMQAHRINQPILLIHGEADDNSGTFPLQSERLYGAIAGHGGSARLVMLPHESHGYRARQSILHMLWETDQWLDRYVRNAEPIVRQEADPEPEAVEAGG